MLDQPELAIPEPKTLATSPSEITPASRQNFGAERRRSRRLAGLPPTHRDFSSVGAFKLEATGLPSGRGDVSTLGAFKHSPLPDASRYIRLLSIKYGDPAACFGAECFGTEYALSTWRFEEAPAYHAISYTWGPPGRDETIRVDKKCISVRKNCADVLRQICHFRTAQYYWIDTLCIDQNNLEEKGRQVAIMGSIYQRAGNVLASLGAKGDEDASSMRLLSEYDTHGPGIDTLQDYLYNNGCQRMVAWVKACPARSIFRLWLLCLRLIRREYFKRVWTTPEFLLAKEVTFCIGHTLVRWHTIWAILYYFEYKRRPDQDTCSFYLAILQPDDVSMCVVDSSELTLCDVAEAPAGDISYLQYVEMAWNLFDTKELMLADLELPRPHGLELKTVVKLALYKFCSDPRDTVYAMLPLLGYEGKFLEPDYTRTAFDLALAIKTRTGIVLHDFSDLIFNLGLCRGTAEIEAGLRQRRVLWSNAEMLDPTPDSWQPHRKFRYRTVARRFHHASAIQLGELAADGAIRSVLQTVTGEVIGFASAKAMSGDWILELPPLSSTRHDLLLYHPHNLIVRPIADRRFAIVGLGATPGARGLDAPREANQVRFDVWFEPADYVIYLASMVYDEATYDSQASRLNVGVCHAPFSSYAKLLTITQEEAEEKELEIKEAAERSWISRQLSPETKEGATRADGCA